MKVQDFSCSVPILYGKEPIGSVTLNISPEEIQGLPEPEDRSTWFIGELMRRCDVNINAKVDSRLIDQFKHWCEEVYANPN